VVLVSAVLTVRDQYLLGQMNALFLGGRHQDVLAHRLPSAMHRRTGEAVQAGSAVLTGRFALALDLLGPPGPPGRPAHGLPDPSDEHLLRAAALVGLGRYSEVAALLGERPAGPAVQRVRAHAAIEVGDDELAERLLHDQHRDLMDEAGRRRLLGELRIRRGRLAEGEELSREAMALYAGLDDDGTDVDEAYCRVLLGRCALRAARLGVAAARAELGLRGLQQRPDNAPGLAEAHGLVAEIRAGLGDAEGAEEHLHRAREQALLCGSEPLDAEVARAAAMVALRLDHTTEARQRLREALELHEALGARPMADEISQALSSLGD
jgi:tetratricopeptide (TPR) repeat protein